LGYFLEENQEKYLNQLFNNYAAPDVKILLTDCRSDKQSKRDPWFDDRVAAWQFNIVKRASGFYKGKELTRVLVLTRAV